TGGFYRTVDGVTSSLLGGFGRDDDCTLRGERQHDLCHAERPETLRLGPTGERVRLVLGHREDLERAEDLRVDAHVPRERAGPAEADEALGIEQQPSSAASERGD